MLAIIIASAANVSPISLPSPLQAINSNFTFYYLLAQFFLIGLVLACAKHLPRLYAIVLLGFLVVLSAYCAVQNAAFFIPPKRVDLAGAPKFIALYADVENSTAATEKLLISVAAIKPQILAVSGVTHATLEKLEAVKTLKLNAAEPRDDGFGTALFSSFAANGAVKTSVSDGFDGLPPLLQTELAAPPGQSLLVTVLKLPFPDTKELDHSSSLFLRRVFVALRHDDRNLLVMGNFNAAPASIYYSRIQWTAAVKDVMDGFGFHPTCCSGSAWFHLPLSHIFVRGNIAVEDSRVLASLGVRSAPITTQLAFVP